MLHYVIIFLYKYEFGFVWNSQGVGDISVLKLRLTYCFH